MFDGSRDWMDRAEAVADPDVEIFFAARPTFYVGDPNDLAQLDDPRFEIPITAPAIGDGTAESLSTRAVAGREDLLAAHYRAVVEQAVAAGQNFDDIRTHFWMRLSIWWEGGELSFPWYDSWTEMDNLLAWLPLADDDADWWDMDQGWELAAVRRGSRFYFRQGDGAGGEHAVVSMDRETLLAKVSALRGRILPIIEQLSALLGADVWTSYGPNEIDFGTADWQPGA